MSYQALFFSPSPWSCSGGSQYLLNNAFKDLRGGSGAIKAGSFLLQLGTDVRGGTMPIDNRSKAATLRQQQPEQWGLHWTRRPEVRKMLSWRIDSLGAHWVLTVQLPDASPRASASSAPGAAQNPFPPWLRPEGMTSQEWLNVRKENGQRITNAGSAVKQRAFYFLLGGDRMLKGDVQKKKKLQEYPYFYQPAIRTLGLASLTLDSASSGLPLKVQNCKFVPSSW